MSQRPGILVVDDDSDFRTVVAEILRAQQFEIREAGNGRVALQLARERLPDLILTDLAMPSMDGWQLCQELARDGQLARVPVVVLSAMASTHAPGGLRALDKPLDVDALILALATSLTPAQS
jgi:CheY-like chemotaxis protein